jgi:DNA-binding NarL/FixJ family response regulator
MNLYIVEDSPHIAQRLVDYLTTGSEVCAGVCVLGVARNLQSAATALSDIAATSQALLHTLLLDLHLPDGNGLSLIPHAKQLNPEIRVVVLTNHDTEANRLHAHRAGADLFLDKSTDFEQLPGTLARWQSARTTVKTSAANQFRPSSVSSLSL